MIACCIFSVRRCEHQCLNLRDGVEFGSGNKIAARDVLEKLQRSDHCVWVQFRTAQNNTHASDRIHEQLFRKLRKSLTGYFADEFAPLFADRREANESEHVKVAKDHFRDIRGKNHHWIHVCEDADAIT